jgi:hypothetical protein
MIRSVVDLDDKQQRTRRIEAAMFDLEVLMSFYPASENQDIHWNIMRAKEMLFTALEISKHYETSDEEEE